MPRNTSSIYYIPPGTEGFPDTTIESVKYNTYIADVAADLNLPRPIVAGGTGADDINEALANLGAEKASQLVTNYDTHLFYPGSFYSAAGATGAPGTGSVMGWAVSSDVSQDPPLNQNVVLIAREQDKIAYVREKVAGVWSAWRIDTDTTRAPIESPVFTGDARAPTPPTNDSDTTIATTAYVNNVIAASPVGAAAAIDALAFNGIQINGGFDVWQDRGISSTVPVSANGQYLADCWKLGLSGSMAVQAQAGINSLSQLKGFRYHAEINVNTPQATLTGSETLHIAQTIEGWRVAKLVWGTADAIPITIGFWSAHSRTGVYSVAVSGGGGRSYVTTYTQAAANVMQYNVVTINGDVAGTWLNATNESPALTLYFTIAAGPSMTAPAANTWYSTVYHAAPGQINGASASGQFALYIAGVVILPGVQTIPVSRSSLMMRPFDYEIGLCQRQYQKIYVPDTTVVATGLASTASLGIFLIKYPRMRATPVITLSSLSAGFGFSMIGAGFGPAVTGLSYVAWLESARLECTCTGNLMTAGQPILLQGGTPNNDAAIILNARI